MTNIKILAFSVLAAFSVGAAHAESTLTVGAGVGVVEQSYTRKESGILHAGRATACRDEFCQHGWHSLVCQC